MIKKPITFIMLLLLILNLSLFAKEVKKESDVSMKTEKQSDFIKISNVPSLASTVIIKLNEISEILEEKKEISEIHTLLPSYIKSMDMILQDPINEHLAYISIVELTKKENEWNIYLTQFEKWNTFLNTSIHTFEAKQTLLNKYDKKWNATRTYANKSLAPEAIIEQIKKVIIQINSLQRETKKRYDLLLTDSNSVNSKILALNELLKKNKEAKIIISSKIFYKNGLSLSILYAENTFIPLTYIVTSYKSILEKMKIFIIYYQDNINNLYIFAFISFIIFLFTSIYYYRYKRHKLFMNEKSYSKKQYSFILRPISSSIILIFLISIFLFMDLPQTAKEFQLLLILIPLFRIFQTLVEEKTLTYFYSYFVLFLLAIIERNAIDSELDARVLSLFLSFSLLVYIIFLIKSKVLETIAEGNILKFSNKLFYVSIVLLIISIFADIYGATLLAYRITNGIFVTMYTSILFYVLSVIMIGYLIIILRRRISTTSLQLENFTKSIEKNTTFFIKFFMLFWWFIIVTKSLGIYKYFIDFKENIMALSWEIGASTISVTSIFDFILIVIGTWFFVKLVNIILEVEIFSRFKFARGIPTAITTVVNYMIVISGTFLALSSLGITSQQFTLVLGALGVGIGFGLRNIIANFISGIIMVFERPIQIGDTIEINQTMGTVQGIGARSSTIKTFDGSEVIIPNADFISKEITNWTLSDERRRKTLIFKVALDSDIAKVLEIMDEIIMAHPNVLKDPEPISTFLGFGDYYLEFKLYFWLHENLIIAQSDIAIGVYKMLQKEGIEMPMPKQEFLKHEPN